MKDDVTDHRAYLLHAVRLSREHMIGGSGGPFGAVVVKDGRVIAEGWNQVTSSNDPTAHAEIVAIRRAGAALNDFSLRGATIYSSCEPCPMCLAAIHWARLDAVYFANDRHQAALAGFDDAFFFDELARPAPERSLLAVHMPLNEASEVFDHWLNNAGKIPY
jgi:tRNA(Arg) A34 adenosine deaminase TadA